MIAVRSETQDITGERLGKTSPSMLVIEHLFICFARPCVECPVLVMNRPSQALFVFGLMLLALVRRLRWFLAR
jgi:hypothetical protein